MADIFKKRLEKCSRLMKEEGLDVLLLAKPAGVEVKDCTHIMSELRTVKDEEDKAHQGGNEARI